MAEAIFNHLIKGMGWRAESAGTAPAQSIDPLTIKVLQEIDIDTEGLRPKKVTDEMLQDANTIVSFGCLVPSMFPKDKFKEWIVDEPKTLEDFRNVRDLLWDKIQGLIDEIKSINKII